MTAPVCPWPQDVMEWRSVLTSVTRLAVTLRLSWRQGPNLCAVMETAFPDNSSVTESPTALTTLTSSTV